MDGNTAVTAMAADIAMQRGIVVCNVMVKAGPESVTIQAPRDADSIIAYGGVCPTGEIAYFSLGALTYEEELSRQSARGEFPPVPMTAIIRTTVPQPAEPLYRLP